MTFQEITLRMGRRDVDKELLRRYHLWRARFIDVILCLCTIIFLLNIYECHFNNESTIYPKDIASPFDSTEYIYDDLRKAVTRVCN